MFGSPVIVSVPIDKKDYSQKALSFRDFSLFRGLVVAAYRKKTT